MIKKVSFQGELGAYSHLALQKCFQDVEVLPCLNFKQAMDTVLTGQADATIIPVENSQWGRVTDVHFLLPHVDLKITSEFFLRVNHKLLVLKGAKLNDITHVHSHPQALGQCTEKIQKLNLIPVPEYDTAGAARLIALKNDKSQAAIASELAGQIYDLQVCDADFEDSGHNTTRFIIMQPSETLSEGLQSTDGSDDYITAFVFTTRNIPASLYKVLGGFATNDVNMIRLESYQDSTKFTSSCFYAEIQGHPDTDQVKRAFHELDFFATDFKILGTFLMDTFRKQNENFHSSGDQ